MMAGVFAVLLVALLLSPPPAVAVIQPGEAAPPILLTPYGGGETFVLDKSASATCLLLFVKPDDKYFESAIGTLNDLFVHHPAMKPRLRRAVVVSRFEDDKALAGMAKTIAGEWPLLPDRDDSLYHSYKIIATPTVVIVGPDGLVAAVHPGYDTGLQQHVRVALSELLDVPLPAFAIKEPEKPNMALQMGRRMMARGLWDKASDYFAQAAEAGPLDGLARMELAEIHLELLEFDVFRQMLSEIPAETPALVVKKSQLLQRAQVLQEQSESTPVPPKVIR